MISISSNLLALNAKNNFNITGTKKAKSSEKLSSGYRINRAADDAAGLAISEKMRRIIRGLDQGTTNAADGISWCQIGDGALDEAHDIIHRMSELTIKSLNETNTDTDRLYMEMEFEALQSELDKIGRSTQFNDINIFDNHVVPYYQCKGGIQWDPQQIHVVSAGSNDLIFEYRESETSPLQKLTITVPAGEYTTQELVDEIETALSQTGQSDNIMFEFDRSGYCNANLEGGEIIDAVSGGLSYLLYDMYQGGGFGALIGTTIFPNEYSKLEVVTGQNDHMSFLIEDFDGNVHKKEITLPQDKYTRNQLVDLLNQQLAGTSVKAYAYGTGIKLASDTGMVTGFKGNMFKIDGNGQIYNSVFYDNVKYGDVSKTAASFTGGYVLPTESRDVEHKYYEINSSNNTLVLQPNGMPNSVTLTIPDGNYTAADMAGKLNELFRANNLELNTRVISDGSSSSTTRFMGLLIESMIKGLDSSIGLDPSSSAYDTLFVTREYNQYGAKVSPVNETAADRDGVFTGGRSLVAPLTITSGKNDSFIVSIDGDDYTITMPAKTYNSVEEIRAELHNRLNGSPAMAGYKGKLNVSLSNNQLKLTGAAGAGVDVVTVKANGTNEGYDDLFAGTQDIYKSQTVSGTGSVTLNTPFTGTIKPEDQNMDINFNGTKYPVTLPTGDNVSQQDIIDAIEAAIPPRTVTTPNTFTSVHDTGKTVDNDKVNTATGNSSVSNWSGSNKGSSHKAEGVIGFDKNEPASLTIQPALRDSMTLNSSNNQIQLNINNTILTVTLPEGTYSKNSLKNELQRQIDNTFGTSMGGAIVDLDPTGNKLVLEARLPAGEDGADTFISCSTGTSSFLAELNTTKTAAQWKSNTDLSSSITIDGNSQTLIFQYTAQGETKDLVLTLGTGTYSRSSIVTEINNQLAKTQTGITASLSGTRLILTSDAKGSDVSISYSMGTGGTSAEKLFGPKVQETPADILVNKKTEDSITIEAGKSDQFSLIVNGKAETVTLLPGTYDRNSFVTMLNGRLKDIGVEAYVAGNKLGYRTTSKGSGANISMTYDNGGTSMKSIYGETTTEYPGIKASFDASGKLVLTSTRPGISISVPSSGGSAFQQSIIEKKPLIPTQTDGYHSTTKSYIDGVSLADPLTIDEWNNNLKFTFKDTGSSKTIEIEVPQKDYALPELQVKLQELIDAKAGNNKIKATVDGNGVRLEAVNPGSLNQFSNFSGDFYDKVICSCTEKTSSQTTNKKDGGQKVNQAYTIGRKDVKNVVTEIRKNINDNLTMDLTFDGIEHKLEMSLDPGKYTGEELKEQVQQKINEQLKAAGMEENLIEVGLGDINSGVAGANDSNALNFKLSMNNVNAPAEGQYVIEGVRGNAAFEIFYQTDGKMIPAFIKGTKDISQGVTIGPDETKLSFKVDGTEHSITLPEGTYTREEILDEVNNAFNAGGIPLTAEIEDNVMKISHTKMGVHTINVTPGEAKKEMFFSEEGTVEDGAERNIQMSSKVDDKIDIKQHIFSTSYLRINSVCISKRKYALKAADRLTNALKMISDIRSDLGSTQNRLEYAINNNRNRSENTQYAESRIRDTDMAREMVQSANHSILEQAGLAMISQANAQPERLLQLLQ